MANGAKATVRLKFTSQKKISTIIEALKPEADSPITRRANVNLQKDGSFLRLTVESKDTVALRATLNAYLRWINSTVNVMQLVEDA